jgi:hypothetical protein
MTRRAKIPDSMQVVITAAVTVLTGVLVLVVGRLLELLMLEPLREQRKAIAEIDNNLTFLANRYSNPVTPEQWNTLDPRDQERIQAEANTIRRNASRLCAATNAILIGYGWAERFGRAPKRAAVSEAAKSLIFPAGALPGSSGEFRPRSLADSTGGSMRPLLGMIVVLTCVTALPRRSVAQFPLFKHEMLRGALGPHLTAYAGPPQITFRLNIGPDFPSDIEGTLRCRTRGVRRQSIVDHVGV